jgi:predicted molibdopterin-dependent oxidoreductase YjgC
VSVVYALPHYGPAQAASITAALANTAIAAAGDEAAQALFVLSQEANVVGMRDVGAAADLLPGHRPTGDDGRAEMQRLWGAQLPSAAGLTFEQMSANGNIKALVVLNDNPLMLAPDRGRTQKWLDSLEFLAVIDSLPTDTANLAHAVLPDTGAWAKDGTTTSADRRILRLNQTTAHGEFRQGWRILSELGARLVERFQPGEIRINYQSAAEIMDEIAQVVPLYASATYREMDPGAQQKIDGLGPKKSERQAVPAAPASSNGDGFTLSATRSLFTSYEAAAVHNPDADQLHRDDAVRINPIDAATLGIADGDTVVLRNARGRLAVRASLTEAVQSKSLHLPLYYDGGAVAALFDAASPVTTVEVAPA